MAVKTIPLPLASFQLPDLRAGSKRLVGCYPEPSLQSQPDDQKDDNTVATLRRWPGITQFTGSGFAGAVRGIWEMAGTVYAVVGADLYSVSPAGVFTLISVSSPGLITGSGFVRMTDNGACLVILVPGTDLLFTYSPFSGGNGFIQVNTTNTPSASFFFNLGGAIDVWYVDTFIVFLANNNGGNGSSTFLNDDGRLVSGNATITFTTAASFSRQFGTDPFYGMCIDHRELLMFGSRSSEGFVNTGNAVGSPFSTAPDTYMPYGVNPQCQFTIALQDNSVFWVANDLTVRRREGQTPARVSNAGIEALLSNANKVGGLVGAYAIASPLGSPTWNGHPFYILTLPAMQRTVAYDCVTQQWFDLVSVVNGQQVQYRALSYLNAFGKQMIGDSQSGIIGFLDDTTQLEFGTTVVCEFTTQPIYEANNRLITRRVEAVITAGAGTVANYAPVVSLFTSDNWGQTYDVSGDDSQTLGLPGDTDNRAIWWNLGQHYSLVLKFRVTDQSPTFTVDIHAEYEQCRY